MCIRLSAQSGERRSVVGVDRLAAGAALGTAGLAATGGTGTAAGTTTGALATAATGTAAGGGAVTVTTAALAALLPLAGGAGELAVEFDKDLFLLGRLGLGGGGLFLAESVLLANASS